MNTQLKINVSEIFSFLKHESAINILLLLIWLMFHFLLLFITIKISFWKVSIYCMIAIVTPFIVLSSKNIDNKELMLVCIRWIIIGIFSLFSASVVITALANYLVQVIIYYSSYVYDFFAASIKF